MRCEHYPVEVGGPRWDLDDEISCYVRDSVRHHLGKKEQASFATPVGGASGSKQLTDSHTPNLQALGKMHTSRNIPPTLATVSLLETAPCPARQ